MEDLLLLALIIGLPAVALLIAFGCAWTGRWRTWAEKGPGPFIFTKRNYAPMHLGVAGLALLCIIPAVLASLDRWEHAEALWTVLIVVFAPIGIGMRWWWPSVATPRWHKDWVRRGGTDETPLWGPGESEPMGTEGMGRK
ncbi:hypothetical protein [Arthrobacter sp. JSM 101049]|uniref:hypothetical protein n=1 Tax=Arthrobacter sp. JSM 101049 TaxID=929097 RepID=UPI0035686F32